MMQTTLMECEIGIVDKFWELVETFPTQHIMDGRDWREQTNVQLGLIAQGGMMGVMQETH